MKRCKEATGTEARKESISFFLNQHLQGLQR